MEKIILVDGNNLLFRSFYATSYTGNIMRNSKGFPTNAILGFINMMNKIIVEEKPVYIMVAFDKGKTFRHEKYADYKGGRDETPIELKQQFPVAKDILKTMGIKYFEIDNYEADDIIGTFARVINEDKNYIGTIISSDKDLLQLITDEIDVKLLKQTGYIRMDVNTFKETYKVPPINMIDIKALMGDQSDNIPGVKGIGEKTAINLLEKYQTIENLYNHIDEITGKTKDKLIQDKDKAFFSKEMATIYNYVPIDTSFENIKYQGINQEAYLEILNELELFSIIKKIATPTQDKSLNKEYRIIENLNNLEIKNDYSIYIEILGSDYHRDEIIGVSIFDGENNYFISKEVLLTNPNFFISNNKKYTYDLKKLIVVLNRLGMKINNCTYDAILAGYLLNYNIKDDIAYLSKIKDYDIDFYENIFGKGNKLAIPNDKDYISHICMKSEFIYRTKDEFLKQLEDEEELYLFNNIELPLSIVLADMEITGIKVNKDYLIEYGNEISKEIETIEKQIYQEAGFEFNISSPKQLADVLFIKMNIPYPKRIKDNSFSTSKEVLEKLTDYPIINLILRYRTVTKLKSTYIDGLINVIMDDNRIHTIYTQTLTKTGRLSSINPNLQNIPMRSEEGRLIRKAFLPDDNSYLLSSDYSQIELRVFASLSNTTELINAFKEGKDIHRKTASDIFGVNEDDVTKDMRRTAKAVNFGILYGISGFGLSEDLGIDIKTAKEFIDKYLETYPGIKEYMEKEIKKAYETGYVKTIMNRKRVIEELQNKNFIIRSQGERIALNTPIQGSAADILKKAMVEIYNEFNIRNLKSKILLQVHDELVINVLDNEVNEVKEIVKNKMENVYKFDVPLTVEIDFGRDWYQAK